MCIQSFGDSLRVSNLIECKSGTSCSSSNNNDYHRLENGGTKVQKTKTEKYVYICMHTNTVAKRLSIVCMLCWWRLYQPSLVVNFFCHVCTQCRLMLIYRSPNFYSNGSSSIQCIWDRARFSTTQTTIRIQISLHRSIESRKFDHFH